MTPDQLVEVLLRAQYIAHLERVDGYADPKRVDEFIKRCREFPGTWDTTRAGLDAVIPLILAGGN